MSNPDTPVTDTSSHGDNTMRQNSTQPSSPAADTDQDVKMKAGDGQDGQAEVEGNEEEMDVKAKALMHLLNTSEVRQSG